MKTLELENIDVNLEADIQAVVSGRRRDEDSLSFYIRQVNHLDILSKKEEMALATAWYEHQDRKAANKLLAAHLKLVVKIASRYKGYGFPMEDLIAEGSVGLMKSLKNFDHKMENRFSTYAMWWIKAEIKEYVLHNWSLVKMGTTRAQRRLFFSLRKTKRKLQEAQDSFSSLTEADFEAIAEELQVPKKAVKSMNARMGNRDFSLNAKYGDSQDDETEWLDTLSDDEPDQEERYIDEDLAQKRKALLKGAMSALSEREAQIIHHRRMVDAPVTLEELASTYGLSRERIRQIESAAFEKLQATILKSAQTAGMAVSV